MAMLVWACLVLGVSSSRIAAGSGLAKQQQAASASSAAVAESFATNVARSLGEWWKEALGVDDNDDDEDDDDKRRNDDDDDDNVKDNNNQCAERDERSRECGASDSFPRKCCGSLVCDPSGNRCRREGDIEEKEEKEEVEALECSLLGMRSQQCGGGGALPVTCCGDLVCNESNRCDDPANAGNVQDDAPVTDGGKEDADLSTCASDGDRAIECGATNDKRPQKCCPGHICSNEAGFFARCVKDPTAGGTPGTDVPVTPDIPKVTLEPTGAGKCCMLPILLAILFICMRIIQPCYNSSPSYPASFNPFHTCHVYSR